MKSLGKNIIIGMLLGSILAVATLLSIYDWSEREVPIKQKEQVDKTNSDNITYPGGYGVSAGHPLAVKVGMEILQMGGNAVDAAVAVAYALGVVEPYDSGIGGGGVMLIHPTDGEEPIAYDYREVAPLSGKTPKGYVGVPGFVKGMEAVHNAFGTMDIGQLIEPAIILAEEGFEVDSLLSNTLTAAQGMIRGKGISHLYPGGRAIRPGAILIQKDLGKTLRTIKDHGSDAFYKGIIAEQVLANVEELKSGDLEKYSVVKSIPVVGKYRDYDIIAPPPPVGGISMIQILQVADILGIERNNYDLGDFIHILSEIHKRVNSNRVNYIADPSFVDIDIDKLISIEYSKEIARRINPDLFTEDEDLEESPADRDNDGNTTHFVIVDRNGMMVSSTQTLSDHYGSGIYVAGFFLNNQLKNFNLNSRSINYIEPRKRPRSHMSPIIFAKDGLPVMGIGTSGGNRIPAILAQVILSLDENNKLLQQVIDHPRFYLDKNTVYVEKSIAKDQRNKLTALGYNVVDRTNRLYYGGVQILGVDYINGKLLGGADQRRNGTWKCSQ